MPPQVWFQHFQKTQIQISLLSNFNNGDNKDKNKMFKNMGGNIPGGNFLGGNYPEGIHQGDI